MQPTSLASERLFKDKLLYGTTRQTLTEEHGEGFIFLHDYLNKRMTPAKFSICDGQLQADLLQAQQVKVRELLHLIPIIISSQQA
jgi:hypothetical protein